MRKKIIGAICVVIGAIGVITVDILDTAGLMSKRWTYALKGGYQYYELFHKAEVASKSVHKTTQKIEPTRQTNKVRTSPVAKLIIRGEVKHVDQRFLLDNLNRFTEKYGNETVYVTNPDGQKGYIPISQLRTALDEGYTLFDDSKNL